MTASSSTIWLAVLVLVVCTEGGVTSTVTRENFFLVDEKRRDSTTKRILRVSKTVNNDVEERLPVAEEIARIVEKASVSGAKTVESGGEKTGEKLFEELQAGGDVLETLEHPNLNALIMSYVAKPQEKPSIKYFLDEEHLDVVANALFRASQKPTTKENAEELLVQLLDWHATKETSAAEFFNLLKLPHDQNAFVKNEFLIWGRYATLLNEKGRSQETYIEALMSVFGGEKKLMEAIWKGKTTDNNKYNFEMKAESGMIESSLIEKWYSESSDPYSLLDRQEMDLNQPEESVSWLGVVLNYIEYYNVYKPPQTFAGWFNSKKENKFAVTKVIAAAKERGEKELEKALKEDWERLMRQSTDAVKTSTGKTDDKKLTSPETKTSKKKKRTIKPPKIDPQTEAKETFEYKPNINDYRAVITLAQELMEPDIKLEEAGIKLEEAGIKLEEAGIKLEEDEEKLEEAGIKLEEAEKTNEEAEKKHEEPEEKHEEPEEKLEEAGKKLEEPEEKPEDAGEKLEEAEKKLEESEAKKRKKDFALYKMNVLFEAWYTRNKRVKDIRNQFFKNDSDNQYLEFIMKAYSIFLEDKEQEKLIEEAKAREAIIARRRKTRKARSQVHDVSA